MTAARLPTALAFLALFTGAAFGADQQRLERRGYEIAWQGDASIPTCIHGEDRYPLGNLVFICDQFTADVPYYAGEAAVLTRPGNAVGYLCLDEDDDCIKGTISGF